MNLKEIADNEISKGCAFKKCTNKPNGVYAFKIDETPKCMALCLNHKSDLDDEFNLGSKAKWFAIQYLENILQ